MDSHGYFSILIVILVLGPVIYCNMIKFTGFTRDETPRLGDT